MFRLANVKSRARICDVAVEVDVNLERQSVGVSGSGEDIYW
jgi:hypothetical protein